MEKNLIDPIVISTIFGFPNEDGLLESFDMLLLEKIIATPDNKYDVINYLDKCYKLSLNYGPMYQEIVNNYLISYIVGGFDSAHTNIFEDWIIDNECFALEFIIRKIPNHLLEKLIHNIFNKFVEVKEPVKYNIVKSLLSIDIVRDYIMVSHKKYRNGFDEEHKGIFRWIASTPLEKNIENLILTLKPLIDDHKHQPELLKILSNIIDINTPYTYSDINMIKTKKCSSYIFLFHIFHVVAYIYNNFSANIEKKYTEPFPRSDFKTHVNDNIATIIYILACQTFFVCYPPQLNMYNYNKKYRDELKEIIARSPTNELLKTRLAQCEKFLTNHKAVIDNYNTDNFIISILNQKECPINDEFIDSYMYSISGKEAVYGDIAIGDEIFDFLLKFNDITRNPNIKYDTVCLINKITTYSGYRGKYIDIMMALFRYITEVNYHEIIEATDCHIHFRNILTIISTISIIIKRNKNTDIGEHHKYIFKGIHKICSQNTGYLDYLVNHCKILMSKPDLLSQKAFLKEEYFDIIDRNMVTIINTYSSLNDIINNIIKDIDLLTNDLIMPIVSMIIGTITFLCDGKNPIYSVYEMNMISLDVFTNMFELINTIKNNSEFKREIHDYISSVKELLPRVKMNKKIKDELTEYFNNYNLDDPEYINVSDLPEEFVDPLLCIPIKVPVMIPNVKLIFDRTSIVSQLHHDKVNPYTREPMTVEQVDKYNTEESVISQINSFKDKFALWLQERKQK